MLDVHAKNSLPHHLAALWFADIAGYSARGVEDEQGALELSKYYKPSLAVLSSVTKVGW